MKHKLSTRVLSMLMAIIMMLSLTTSVFAADSPASAEPEVVVEPETAQNSPVPSGSPASGDDPSRLTTIYEGHRIHYIDSKKQPLPKNAELFMNEINEDDVPFYLQRAAHSLGLESCDMYLYFIADPMLEDASTAEILKYQANPDDPEDRMTVVITLLDDSKMTDEEKELRLEELQNIHLDDLRVIQLGAYWDYDTVLPHTEENGVIRFEIEKIAPFILFIPDWESAVPIPEEPEPTDVTEEIAAPAEDTGTQEETKPVEQPAELSPSPDNIQNKESASDEEPIEEAYEQTVTASGSDYSVSLTYTADANIPEGSMFELSELPASGILYDTLTTSVANALNADAEEISSVTFVGVDVKKDGDSVPLDAPVNVSIAVDDPADSDTVTQVVALGQQNEVLNTEEGTGTYSSTIESLASTYAIVRITKQATLKTSDDQTWLISVTYDRDDSSIPADVELSVKELKEGDPGYDEYIAASAAVTGADRENLAFAKAFDICLIDPATGLECQPTKEVSVSIQLLQEKVSDSAPVDVIHFGEDESPEQLDAALNAENAIEFATPGFSVFVIMQVIKEQVLTASDGQSYKVTVTYDKDSGIPEDAELSVSEITEDDEGYADYVAMAVEKLGTTPENLAFARPFDITLKNPETGERFQPDSNVTVSVRLLDEEVSADSKVDVVHFGPEVETLDCEMNNQVIEFETDGFSVYVFVAYTVDFHWGEYTYSIAGESEILLSALLEKLGVTEITLADVADVRFSDPTLVEVEKIEESEGQTSDWLLRSLAPFDTEETLTLSLANGQRVEVRVTDDATVIASGTCGTDGHESDVTWVLDSDGVLTFSGSGAMKDYTRQNYWVRDTPWYEYIKDTTSPVKKVVVNNGITRIGTNALCRARNLESVDSSNCTSLVSIGESTFKMSDGSSKLKTVDFSGCVNLTTIDPQAFRDCRVLETVNFSGCSNLKKIDGNIVFQNCSAIKTLNISGTKLIASNLTTDNGFASCKGSLLSLNASNCSEIKNELNLSGFSRLEEIDLSNCTNITSVVPPNSNSVVTLNLDGCTKITSLDLSGKQNLKNLTLPSTLKTLNLTGCSVLESLDLPASVTSLNLTGCAGLESLDLPASVTSLNLTNCTGLQDFTIPKTLTSLDLTGCQGVTFRFDGTRGEWENLKTQPGYVVPDDVIVVCDPLVSSDLRYFVDSVTYSVGSDPEVHQISDPAIVRTGDVFTMSILFAEKPDTDPDCRMFDFTTLEADDPVLTYELPQYVSVYNPETYSQQVIWGGFSGNIHVSGGELKLTWDYTGHTEEQIRRFEEAIIAFSIQVPVTIGLPDSLTSEAQIPFGKDYLGQDASILKADRPHNPFVFSKTAAEYDPATNTVTFTVVVKADGNVDNNGSGYPVVIRDVMGEGDASALTFKSGMFSYTGSSEAVIEWTDGSQTGPGMDVEFSGFPVTVNHMHHDDAITFTYVASVDTDKISQNGTAKPEETGNTVTLTNEGNPYNDTSDDVKVTDPVLVLFPEIKKELKSDSAGGLADYQYEFSVYVSRVTEADLTEGNLLIQDILDEQEGAATADAALWTVSSVAAYGMDSLEETEGIPVTCVLSSPGEGQALFTLSDLKKQDESFYSFYKIVYIVEPKDDASLAALRERAIAADPIGELGFNNSVILDKRGSSSSVPYTFHYLPISKTMTRLDGNWAYYELGINPDAMTLNSGNWMELSDTFSVNQSIDYRSIHIDVPSVVYDYRGQTGTFYIPDQTPVTITYRTRIRVANDQTVTFYNDALLDERYPARVEETRTIYPGGEDIGGATGDYWIWLFKYPEISWEEGMPPVGGMGEGIGDAEFRLLDFNKSPIKAGEAEITYTSGSDGYVKVQSKAGITLQKNTVYYLEEIKAPAGYKIDNTLYSFLITDNPNYSSDFSYSYFVGDVLKVRNYPEEAQLYMSKRFSGNRSLTDEEKEVITFTLQKYDENAERWVDVDFDGEADSIPYTVEGFYYGYSEFKTHGGGLVEGAQYRVVETFASSETGDGQNDPIIPDQVKWVITFGDGSDPISFGPVKPENNRAEGPAFTATDENKQHAINILCDNEYIQKKLTLRKVDELDGKLLSGAEFTVYNTADQAENTYITDQYGIAEIVFDDRYYSFDKLYYAAESKEPTTYLLPSEPERIYFYFSSPAKRSEVPTGLPAGAKAVDLSVSFDDRTITNRKRMTDIPVLKVWEGGLWPEEIARVEIGLYRSVNGSDETQVTDDEGNPLIATLTANKRFDTETFKDMLVVDAQGNSISYSVRELHVFNKSDEDVLPDYSPIYYVTDAGVYVIRNTAGISIDVNKLWFDKDTKEAFVPGPNWPSVTFDVYRTLNQDYDGEFDTENDISRENLTGFLRNKDAELVRAGLTLSNENDWEMTVSSLQAFSPGENPVAYTYFVVETENLNYEDRYQIVPAATPTDIRQLTVKNTGEARYICKVDMERFYSLNDALAYIVENDMYTAAIEMLTDYIMPVTDALEIPRGYTVTLTTSSDTEEEGFPFVPPETDPERTTAIIRRYVSFTEKPMFNNRGTLAFENITLEGDGENVHAIREMICSDGTLLQVKTGAEIKNAYNVNNGGAILSRSGVVSVLGGSISNCKAKNGGAIFASGGDIVITNEDKNTEGTILQGNKADQDGGAVYNAGSGAVMVTYATLSQNEALDGSGGAIYANNGPVRIGEGAVLSGNLSTNGSGGAVYAQSAVVGIEGEGTQISGNQSVNGAAVYVDSGTVNITGGTISGNEASGNGGAIYAESGIVHLESGSLTENEASGNGGAVYAGMGSVTMSGGSITKNQSQNGSAVFVNTGSAGFSAGVIGGTGEEANIASDGGAVGIGSVNAVLRFTNTIRITGNRNGSGDAANVYLDQNSDNVIHVSDLVRDNAETGVLGAKIGIYVSDDQLDNRGIPGTKFAAYSGKDVNVLDNKGNPVEVFQESFIGIIENDRSDLVPIADTSVRRILWGKSIEIQVRYVSSYMVKRNNNRWEAKFPPENVGRKVYPSGDYYTFYPASSDSALSEVADNLRNRAEKFNPGSNTAVFGHAFAKGFDTDSAYNQDYYTFDQYLTRLYWDDTADAPGWKLEMRDGNSIPCERIVIFFTEPSYLSIENNSEERINISELSVLGHNAINTEASEGVSGQTGYGYVTARSGKTRDALYPITADDLVLEKGDSIKMLFPGAGVLNDTYLLDPKAYHMQGLIDGEEKQHKLYRSYQEREDDHPEGRYYVNQVNNEFDLTGAKMYQGDTYEIIFETLKPICKIVSTTINSIETGDIAGSISGKKEGETEYLFASISQAVSFADKYLQKVAQIEMLTDYLLPYTDAVNFPKDCRITLTTAVDGVKTYQDKDYADYTDLNTVRALISRDSGNDNTLLQVQEGSNGTTVTLYRLRFDGKNLAGNINGGVLRTLDADVTVEYCTFNNCVANNGGGMYIDYTIPQVQQTDANGNPMFDKNGNPVMVAGSTYSVDNKSLTVQHCEFNDCASKSTLSRVGGGAVWTTAKTFNLTDCRFERCTSVDQGGAVFHRADTYIAGSSTIVSDCWFANCEARAAGAFESDTSSVTMTICTFEHCSATMRNGGAFNVYSNNLAETADPSVVTVRSCRFIDCHADGTSNPPYYGGALRSAAKVTTVEGCTFENTSCMYGGAIAISNKKAEQATISGCEISYGSASIQGGGIYSNALKTEISNTTVKYCSTSGGNGGGIYHNASSANNGTIIMSRTSIENCTAGGTESVGGGLYTNANKADDPNLPENNIKLENCQFRNNTASGSGGGIYCARMLLDKCVLIGNTAGNKGGGLYTTSVLTLRNETFIRGNRLTVTGVENGAGVYLDNLLTVGTPDAAAKDNTTIKENYTADGKNSNLRLRWNSTKNENHRNSIAVNCGLGGEIFVVNAAKKSTVFGDGKIASPAGFADMDHVFVSDDGTMYAIISRTDKNYKQILWAGDPICKISDSSGNVLFFDDMHTSPAVFDKLDVGNSGTKDRTSAFSTLRLNNLILYTQAGAEYTGDYYVEMLVDEYVAEKFISTPQSNSMNIVFTTAKASDADGFPYRGKTSSRATVMAGPGLESLLTSRANLTLRNIVLDGGWQPEQTEAPNTRILSVIQNTVTLGENAVLRNAWLADAGDAIDAGAGAGAILDGGSLTLDSGSIQKCKAQNGGGIYLKGNGKLELIDGRIANCEAQNGGGIYQNNGEVEMKGGIITGNTGSGSGGGLFLKNVFRMTGGSITGNSAVTAGGGIAVDGARAKLHFSGDVQVRQNMKTGFPECNVELDQDSIQIINTSGLAETAYVGIFVPDTPVPGVGDKTLYKLHGVADTPFGKFTGSTENLRRFANDRNGLRAGNKSDDPGTIYWIQIFFLEVSKEVTSDRSSDKNQTFVFQVELTGEGTDKEGKKVEPKDISTIIPGDYGEIWFTKGEATICMKHGQKLTAENLPRGMDYTVEELLVWDNSKQVWDGSKNVTVEGYDYSGYYATVPTKDNAGRVICAGKFGDTSEETLQYLSRAEFKNIHAVCKITAWNHDSVDDHTLLYYRTGGQYEPAVYSRLYNPIRTERSAFRTINNSTPLYYKVSDEQFEPYSGGDYNVEMLIEDYGMSAPAPMSIGRNVRLTTAQRGLNVEYPYVGTGTATVRRAYSGNSMFEVNNGSLTLENIMLDGNKNVYNGTGNGGILTVGNVSGSLGALNINETAVLSNSRAANGGAVYVTPYGTLTMTGGTINNNESTGSGAGIYLAEGSKLNISGNPNFGGTDVDDQGDLIPPENSAGNFKEGELESKTNGGKVYIRARQDIFIAGYASDDPEATNAASLVVTGDIGSGEGSIWVWADQTPHYKTLCQFAKYTSGVADTITTLAAFRNAQDDATTGADQVGQYLYGITKSDDTGNNVFWYGVEGSAHVMLVKVLKSGASYQALSGRSFTVYTDSGMNSIANGTQLDDNGEEKTISLEGLSSGAGGAFFIGELAYGKYYVKEDGVSGHFEFAVNENGVITIEDYDGNTEDQDPLKEVRLVG